MTIPHHEQAIQMSEMIPAKDGIDAAVTDLAHQIKDAHAPETTPRAAGWPVGAPTRTPRSGMDHGGVMMGEADVDDLENVSGAEAAKLFLSRWLAWFGFSFGWMPHRRPFALATYMPSRVRSRIRSDSNSATISNTLKNNRWTGSVGSWIEPPKTQRDVPRRQRTLMSRASGKAGPAGPAWSPSTCHRRGTPGQRHLQTRPVPVRCGQTMINIGSVITYLYCTGHHVEQ